MPGKEQKFPSATRLHDYLNTYLERDPLLVRFHTQPSLPLLDSMLAEVVSEVQKKTGDSMSATYQEVADAVPLVVSTKVQKVVLDAVASSDKDVRQTGKRVFMFLNLRSILSTLSPYIVDNKIEGDDIVQSAVSTVYEKIDTIGNHTEVPEQISKIVVDSNFLTSLAREQNMPRQWVKEKNHGAILTTVDAALEQKPKGLGKQEISDIARDLSDKTGYDTGRLDGFIDDRNTIFLGGVKKESTDITSSTVINKSQTEALAAALGELDPEQRRVLELKYALGTNGGKGMSDQAISAEIGKFGGRVSLIDSRARAKLKENEKLKGYWKAK